MESSGCACDGLEAVGGSGLLYFLLASIRTLVWTLSHFDCVGNDTNVLSPAKRHILSARARALHLVSRTCWRLKSYLQCLDDSSSCVVDVRRLPLSMDVCITSRIVETTWT